jgi:hypothetical protein
MTIGLKSIGIKAFAAAGTALLLLGLPAGAQDKPRTDIPKELADQLIKEKEARLGCKKSICEAARNKAAQGDNIACKVTKTWPDVDLKNKILKGRMEWPFGHAQCEASISIDRKLLAAVAGGAKSEAKIGKHDISCQLSTKDGTDKHALTFSIDPVVTFENGKAAKASLNWGNVGGTTIAKSAAWSATAVDNTFNVLQGAVIEQINDFFASCDEVK